MRPEPCPEIPRWLAKYSADDLYSTSVSLAEIFYGIELLPSGKRKTQLLAGTEKLFKVMLARRILPFEEAAARWFSTIAVERRVRGTPMAELDAQIAAIARVHGATLATRNTSDFEGCGIRLVNPWVD